MRSGTIYEGRQREIKDKKSRRGAGGGGGIEMRTGHKGVGREGILGEKKREGDRHGTIVVGNGGEKQSDLCRVSSFESGENVRRLRRPGKAKVRNGPKSAVV